MHTHAFIKITACVMVQKHQDTVTGSTQVLKPPKHLNER